MEIQDNQDMRCCLLTFALACGAALAQDPPAAPEANNPAPYVIQPGTRIPLSMINSVNTKNSAAGDRVYLQTVFPILAGGKIVIPPGSYVQGTVTEVKRPGRVKGRGMLLRPLRLPDSAQRCYPRVPRPRGLDRRSRR